MNWSEAVKKGPRYCLAWDIAMGIKKEGDPTLMEFLDYTGLWNHPRMGQIVFDIWKEMKCSF